MVTISDDYRARAKEAVEHLFRQADELTEQYSRYVDAHEVPSTKHLFASIKLDLEQALANYEPSEARLIREELRVLVQDLRRRIDAVKEARYQAVIERQSASRV